MTRTAHVVLFVSLALWVGGLATISFVVAPTAFQKAPTKVNAGQIVGTTLRTFGRVEIACGALALAASFLLARGKPARGWEKVRIAVLVVMLMATLANVLSVYPDAAVTRAKMATLKTPDPITQDHFALLHRVSVILVSINILLGAITLAVSAAQQKPSDGA